MQGWLKAQRTVGESYGDMYATNRKGFPGKLNGIHPRKKVKLPLFADDMTYYIENPKESPKKLFEAISEFSRLQNIR